ncbi:MAG TPA: LysM peptidoglycan-binding domain-containing protein [Kofleriaceae bacterium]|nr:LysM peptidoglycan-binding domain-containing protein [Kofleriaceae bacterium]
MPFNASKPNPYLPIPAKNATLEVVRPKPATPDPIPLCFNPAEYQVQKQNTYKDVPIPGLGAPPVQFISGGAEKLTFDATVDTSDTLENVHSKWVSKIRDLLDPNDDIHAPPVVKFTWESFYFVGVIESLNITYTLFTDAGQPIRAKLSFTLREYSVEKQQAAAAKRKSADVEKTYVVQRGDTLSGIAQRAYGDPAPWREIARANGIGDPRTLEPGQLITIPRLEATL